MPMLYTLQTQAEVARDIVQWAEEAAMGPDQIETLSRLLDALVAECLGVTPPPPFDDTIRTARMPAMDSADSSALAAMQRLRQAEIDVRPVIGTVPPQRSASAVYKLALDAMGVDFSTSPPHTYAALFTAAQKIRSGAHRIAQDAAAGTSLVKRFPGLAKIGRAV
jgi:hypothetical protein